MTTFGPAVKGIRIILLQISVDKKLQIGAALNWQISAPVNRGVLILSNFLLNLSKFWGVLNLSEFI